MRKTFILDPLWITKGTYFDAEYFNYVLLDASLKYKQELENDEIGRFYEVLFHLLNLNNLAVNGNIFTPKFKEILTNTRIEKIRKDLRNLYNLQEDTVEVFKNANFVFSNLLIEYMQIQLDILDGIKMVHLNPDLHSQKDIFIVTNKEGSKKYTVWYLQIDSGKNFGYSFSKVKTITLSEIKENALSEELKKIDDPRIEKMHGQKNICFAIVLNPEEEERKVAQVIKDTVLLNRGMAKGMTFEPTIITELHRFLWFEKILPFTLDQWFSKEV